MTVAPAAFTSIGTEPPKFFASKPASHGEGPGAAHADVVVLALLGGEAHRFDFRGDPLRHAESSPVERLEQGAALQ